ncbi:MAG: hypothetical protein MH204_05490, partial [Fimbriimonadaceae bacterium]|nr:hypothetical protein [Fimbriimonadaceae bacterium]
MTEADHPRVQEICLATGLGGRLDEHFCDREMFLRFWLRPFFVLSPDACWVAESDGRVIAYLVGTFDSGFNRRAALLLLPDLVRLVGR